MEKSRRLIIAGNWKSNKTNAEAVALVTEVIRELHAIKEVDVVVCPAFTALAAAHDIPVIIDEVGEEGATGRSQADAPEIDGQVFIDGATHLQVGQFVEVVIEEADDHDMWGTLAD